MFLCDKCGMCCRNLQLSELYADLNRGDGVCKYLKGNLCSIYESRPMKCRIDDSYEIYFKALMTREEYDRMNQEVCEHLKQEKEK